MSMKITGNREQGTADFSTKVAESQYLRVFSNSLASHNFIRSAMTLAETLVVILIIGVIATMTIPNLVNKTQDVELKTAWKKNYSVLSNAHNLVVADYGGDITNAFDDSNSYFTALSQKLNVQKYCSSNVRGNCWNKTGVVKNLGGTTANEVDFYNAYRIGMILNDGSFILINGSWTKNCTNDSAYKSNCSWGLVDVNGFKGPNMQGKDIFGFYIAKDKIFAEGTQGDYVDKHPTGYGCSTSIISQGSGLSCSALYLGQ